MKRRDFFKLVTAAAAMVVLPFKAIAKPRVSTWRMILYDGETVIAECDGVIQSKSDTFESKITFPDITVTQGDVLQMNYRLVKP